jgi:hypothetical protein
MNNFLKNEDLESMIVQSPNANSVSISTNSETADWIKTKKAIVVLKLIEKIGVDDDSMM